MGAAYGNLYPDIAGGQPERDIFCGHTLPVNLAWACKLVVYLCVRTFPLRLSEKAATHTEYSFSDITLGFAPRLRRLRQSDGLCLWHWRTPAAPAPGRPVGNVTPSLVLLTATRYECGMAR